MFITSSEKRSCVPALPVSPLLPAEAGLVEIARQLVERAREQGVAITDDGGLLTWCLVESGVDRPFFIELPPGPHHVSVVEAHARPDRNVLTRASFEVQPGQIVERSLHPSRAPLSPHSRRSTATASCARGWRRASHRQQMNHAGQRQRRGHSIRQRCRPRRTRGTERRVHPAK